MIKKRIELEKKQFELKEEFAKLGGWAEVLTELKLIKSIDELTEYIAKKEREFWDKSTPIATDLCENLIKMAEEYIKND